MRTFDRSSANYQFKNAINSIKTINHQIVLKTLLVHVFILCLACNMLAQEHRCAGEWIDTLPSESILINCIDEQAVFDNNTIVYLRLNMHFFIGPDCEGPVHWDNTLGVYDLYQWSEDFINEANGRLANNFQQWGGPMWGGPFPPPHLIPIRYVLSDVLMHCVTEEMPPVPSGQNPQTAASNWLSYLRGNYSSNQSAEINVFFTPMTAGSGVGGGRHTNIGWVNAGLFNHELGHVLGLSHVFEGDDGCADTPQITWNYDANCDGDFLDSGDVNNNLGYCWNIRASSNTDCNKVAPCSNHPCCSWDYVDSNVMGDNAIASAYSNCQIMRMLTNINLNKCGHIEAVGGVCPPPKAVIEIHPLDDLRQEYCSYCLRLDASSNDELYKIDIYEITGSGDVLITSTSWLNGPAQLYCIKTKRVKDGEVTWFGGFKPNTNYRAILSVENNCAEQSATELVFSTPETNCNTLVASHIEVFPSPVFANLNINYTIYKTSYIHILSAHSIYGKYNNDFEFSRDKPAGSYSISEEVNTWYPGVNYVVIQVDDQVYSKAIFKQ